jgi:hypothetical protein
LSDGYDVLGRCKVLRDSDNLIDVCAAQGRWDNVCLVLLNCDGFVKRLWVVDTLDEFVVPINCG